MEKEADRTSIAAREASRKASSIRKAIDGTLNKQDAVAEYRNLLTKLDNTCARKLKRIEAAEAPKNFTRSLNRTVHVPGT